MKFINFNYSSQFKKIFIGFAGSFGLINGIYFFNIKKSQRLNLIFDLDETLINSEKSKYINDYNMKLIRKHDCIFEYDSISDDPNKFDESDESDESDKKIIIKKQYYVWKRPHTNIILTILSKYNNLYLMTNADEDYANDICTELGIAKYFKDKKFYEDIKIYNENNNIDGEKDIKIFELDSVNKSILIDDLKSNNLRGQNFYHIPQYTYNKNFDIELIKLLFYIMCKNIENCANSFYFE